MRFASATTSDGVCEQDFTLDDIPGVLWSPAGAAGPGRWCCWATAAAGTSGRRACWTGPGGLVTGCGFAAAAIDMPGFGDRPKTAEDERFVAEIRARQAAGEPSSGRSSGTTWRWRAGPFRSGGRCSTRC